MASQAARARAARASTVVAIVVLVVAAAGVDGPMRLRGRVHDGPVPSAPPSVASPPPPPPPTGHPVSGRWIHVLNAAVGATIALYVLAVLVLAVLALAMLRVRAVRRLRREPGASADSLDLGEELHVPAVVDGVQTARLALRDELPPGDAVVAAWLALERGAEASGVERNPAQTPTELTLAVLDRTQADQAATRGLLDLYLRARFSSRPVTAADVAAARAYLDQLAAGLAHERADA